MIRVLVADDHGIVREGLRRLIESEEDVRVCSEAGDGREVLEQVEKHQPDVVVLDITMPRMTGLEALRELEALGAEFPVLLMTGHEPNADWDMQRAVALVRKPFTRHDVLVPLQRAIQDRAGNPSGRG